MAYLLVCSECLEPAEQGKPLGVTPVTQPDRARYRHVSGRDVLCPVMTSDGYQPALPVRKEI